MKTRKAAVALTVILGCSLAALGCSSSPDADQLRQLDDLKSEYASLQKDVSTKDQQAKTLQQDIADKNAKLQKCHSDEQTVRSRLNNNK